MPPFTLHPQLASDSIFLRDLPLSQLRLHNQKTVPWLILVPRRAGIKEFHHLSAADRAMLTDEIAQASRALEKLYAPDKINIGMLGNIVPQFHAHVIARFATDPAWPAPVWGKLAPEPYAAEAVEIIRAELSDFWK